VSKYSTPGGDGGALLGLLERMRARAQQLTGHPVKIVVIQEAGLDGFWVHRLLEANGIELKVMLSIQRPSPCRGAGGEPRRMRSTARHF
jgi:transposase